MPDYLVKLDRADVHLEGLDRALEEFVKDEPYKLRTEVEAQTRYNVVRLDSRKEVPPWFSAAVGDVLFNLRSGLDQLAFALATKNGPLKRERDSEFPIFLEERSFLNAIPQKIGNVSVEAQTVIEGLQPYHGPEPRAAHPLWLLQTLSIADKHRLLNVVSAVFMGVDVVLERPGFEPLGMARGQWTGGVLEDGAEISRWRQVMGWEQVQMKMHPKPVCEIRFGQGNIATGRLVSNTLHQIRDHVVGTVVPALRGHLADPGL